MISRLGSRSRCLPELRCSLARRPVGPDSDLHIWLPSWLGTCLVPGPSADPSYHCWTNLPLLLSGTSFHFLTRASCCISFGVSSGGKPDVFLCQDRTRKRILWFTSSTCHFMYYPLLINLTSKINHFNLFSCSFLMRFSPPSQDNSSINCWP